jgi:hypothetical protein
MNINARRFITRRLTSDSTDQVLYRDETTGTPTKCDATKMHFKSHNHPGLARYAVIDKRGCNVKWVDLYVGNSSAW